MDDVTKAMKTEPKDAIAALDTLIKQYEDLKETLYGRLSGYQVMIKQQYKDHSEKVQSILDRGTQPLKKTYICKRLGLMGRKKDDHRINFDSMPCSAFDSRSDKEDIALKSLTVSNNHYDVF